MKYFIIINLLLSSCAYHKKHHHRFDDAKKWEKIFEAKTRDNWQEPNKVIASVGIKKSSIVADIGAATGYFPVRIARVATHGRVWGIDIEPSLVNFLNQRAEKEGIKNLFSTLGTFSDPLIPERVDFIFIVNTYHHIQDRQVYFKRLKESLRTNGKIVIIDFRKGKLPFGPKDKMKISKESIIKEMMRAGHSLVQSFDFLKYQNLLVFESL